MDKYDKYIAQFKLSCELLPHPQNNSNKYLNT